MTFCTGSPRSQLHFSLLPSPRKTQAQVKIPPFGTTTEVAFNSFRSEKLLSLKGEVAKMFSHRESCSWRLRSSAWGKPFISLPQGFCHLFLWQRSGFTGCPAANGLPFVHPSAHQTLDKGKARVSAELSVQLYPKQDASFNLSTPSPVLTSKLQVEETVQTCVRAHTHTHSF